jgi:hypothetical protein
MDGCLNALHPGFCLVKTTLARDWGHTRQSIARAALEQKGPLLAQRDPPHTLKSPVEDACACTALTQLIIDRGSRSGPLSRDGTPEAQ